ncbi:MAG TPA: tail fiber domain-containing protein [Saprospiraceae bacterium]|nr:tail fiber domain-containing protein [Saprospiraceae bacterium]
MKQNLILLVFLFFYLSILQAQGISINADGAPPDASAILDVQSSTKGFLIPRMNMLQRNDISSPAAGLMIYQTDNTPGLYMYDGTGWQILTTSANVWTTSGNGGIDPNTQFIGTTDNNPLRIRLNNQWSGELNAATSNACIGDSSGISITSGMHNTSFGHKSLQGVSFGSDNTVMGYKAAAKTNTFGLTVVGSEALSNNTSGHSITVIGSFGLHSNTTGFWNTGIGYYVLNANTTGSVNTATGCYALYHNTGGISNSAFGFQAMQYNLTGGANCAMGTTALNYNESGSRNTAIGTSALYKASQSENTAIGFSAASNTTIGTNNTAIGTLSLDVNETGGNNVAIGHSAGNSLGNIFNSISIGNHNYLNGADNQAFFGNLGIGWNGGNVTWSTFSDARIKTDIQEDVVGLNFINRLRPVTYHRDIDKQAELTGNTLAKDFPSVRDVEKIKFSGFLAQEVEAAALAAGYDFSGITIPKNDKAVYTLSYESFVVPLVKAVQEQQVMIDELKNLYNVQLQYNEQLEKRLAELEARIVKN